MYGKNPSKISGTSGPISMKLGMQHWELHTIIGCSNDDLWLTFTYFTTRSNFVAGFCIGKREKLDFSETIVACDLKVGRCTQLIE